MSDTYTRIPIHMTFSTLNRESLPTDILPRLHAYVGGILNEIHCRPIAIGGIEDHVHALFDLCATRSPSEVARIIKTNSSSWLHDDLKVNTSWQRGYGAFAVSPGAINDVCRYIANQREHHKVRTFRDELIDFLNRAGVEFEARYLE
jgi:REP element-mobilizing transposase RayT